MILSSLLAIEPDGHDYRGGANSAAIHRNLTSLVAMQKAFAIRLMAFASFGLVCVEFKLVTVSCSLWALLVLPENLGAPSSMSAGGVAVSKFRALTATCFSTTSAVVLCSAAFVWRVQHRERLLCAFWQSARGGAYTSYQKTKHNAQHFGFKE